MTKRKPKLAETDIVEAAPEAAIEPIIHSIKGFSSDLKCRGFQFEVGKSYEVSGDIKACVNGFHACPVDEHPLSVFEFYPPAGSVFHDVDQSGETDKHETKLASAKITVNVEISLGELTKRAVDWVFKRAKWADGPVATGDNEGATASGDHGAATASGNNGAATASGHHGAATASGYHGAATASGNRGAATASGNRGAATASGYGGKVSGAAGNALFAIERDFNYNIVSVACGIAGNDVPADVWLICKGGKLIKAED